MKINMCFTGVALCFAVFASDAGAQSGNPAVQQKLAMVKESIARNQAALRQYTWIARSEISLKGEVKKTKDEMCSYSPDGEVQKTPLGQAAPQKELRGVRKRVVEKKVDELTDYMEQAVALIHDYVPPSPPKMEAAFHAGNVSLGSSQPDTIQLQLRNYTLRGDSLVFNFDSGARSLRGISVNTYLGDQKDAVTLQVVFQTLPDGTNYPATTILNAEAKHIQVKTQNINYQKGGL
jgi:hypothetical protein